MPELERQKRRSDWRTYTMVSVIVIIHVAAAYVIVSFYFGYTGMLNHMNDFNAMHATHDAIRMHIERTGVWPDSWKDLKADLRELNVEDVEWIRERVEVDFSMT